MERISRTLVVVALLVGFMLPWHSALARGD